MDVRLLSSRLFFSYFIFSFIFLVACGDRYNLQTERGRRARIDEANLQISAGNCQSALEAIAPLYSSNFIDDEVRMVKASAHACFANFNLLTLLSNMSSSSSNTFTGLVKTMQNGAGDGHLTQMYNAVDALTNSNTSLNGTSRSKDLNTYMVFLQLGLIGTILDLHGLGNATGAQTVSLAYSNPRVGTDMPNEDACAVAAAMSAIVDSYSNSNLNDTDTSAAKNSLEAACVSAGISSCTLISRDRTSCTGLAADVPSVRAAAIIGGINVAW